MACRAARPVLQREFAGRSRRRRSDAEAGQLKKLDLRGLKCPLPVLKTRKMLAALAPGDRIEIVCTDPMSAIDLPNLARETGDVLEEQSRAEDALFFLIRKAGT